MYHYMGARPLPEHPTRKENELFGPSIRMKIHMATSHSPHSTAWLEAYCRCRTQAILVISGPSASHFLRESCSQCYRVRDPDKRSIKDILSSARGYAPDSRVAIYDNQPTILRLYPKSRWPLIPKSLAKSPTRR